MKQQTGVRLTLLLTSAALMGGLFYRKIPEAERGGLVFTGTDRPVSVIAEETDSVRTVIVYISGEVASPGVYELAEGSRIADLLEMAGGALDDANLNSINLAKKLSDGEHISVAAYGSEDTDGRIDLNTADSRTLQELPGIGEAKADAIIRYRDMNGPFQSVDDLLLVSGIGENLLNSIRDRIKV